MSTPAMHLEAAGASGPSRERPCGVCGAPFKPKRPWQTWCSSKCRNDFHGKERRKKAIEDRAVVLFEALTEIARETGTPYATIAAKAIEGLKAP